MKILITGGAGFIGSNLAMTLQASHPDITIIDDFRSGDARNLESFRGQVMEADVANLDLSSKFQGFDVIFHQASITDTTVTDADMMINTNVNGMKNVLDFAARHGSRVVYASSAAVYGNGGVPMRENQELNPLNSYGVSKCRLDELATEYMAEHPGMKIIGLRYFNVFGPGEQHKGKSASMIYQLALQMRQNRRPVIFKHGEQKRDHIYVKDIVAANLRAMEASSSGIANIGTGAARTFNEVVANLNRVLGTDYEPEYIDNTYSFFQMNTQADTHHAERLLGFKAQYSLEDGITDYYENDRLR